MADILKLLAELTRSGEQVSADQWMKLTVSYLRQTLSADRVTLYHIMDQTAHPLTSTDETLPPARPLTGDEQAIQPNTIHHDATAGTASFRMHSPDGDQGLLVIEGLSSDITVEKLDDIRARSQELLNSLREYEATRVTTTLSGTQLHILQTINALTTESHTEDELLQNAARALQEGMKVDHVGIVTIQPNGKSGLVRGDYPSTGVLGVTLENDPIWGIMRDNGEPIVIQDLLNDRQLVAETRDVLSKLGIRACFFIPMFDLSNNLMGSIGFDRYTLEDGGIDPQLIELAQTTTGQISISLQKIRLLEQSRNQAAQMEDITLFAQTIQGTLDTQTIIENAIIGSLAIIKANYIAIDLYNGTTNVLRRVGYTTGSDINVDLNSQDIITAESNSLAFEAWKSRTLTRTDDIHDGSFIHPYRDYIRTAFAVPLVSGGTRLGIIEFANNTTFAYNATDISAAQQIANQIAVALTNAETYNQSLKQARNRSLINEISGRIQQQTELDTLMQVTLSELGQALGAKRGRIRLSMSANPEQTN